MKPRKEAKLAQADQRLLDIAAEAGTVDGIRQGLDDAKRGKLRPATEVFQDFESMNGGVA